ncbi:DUF4148 domain-containing protein [Paraburkholderia sp. MM5384-R2]|uniref:DUF4148 domain-containing protein n=1 Tax=Paraburkholderia sp. MM5384-R2 TaxID=2723097 RepID=UPI00161D38C9|nr:DUF4148 domain-containing protein [Paraburkholderia sp. MM5384-R2]MBB5503210.1 hypothetical protein [Paraburkholderia sp. MM5384-R2]
MKYVLLTFATAIMLGVPVVAFARHASAPITRAQVRAELIQIGNAGYYPAKRDTSTYPSDIQAAEARIARKNVAGAGSDSGMGSATSDASQSGRRIAPASDSTHLFAHH